MKKTVFILSIFGCFVLRGQTLSKTNYEYISSCSDEFNTTQNNNLWYIRQNGQQNFYQEGFIFTDNNVVFGEKSSIETQTGVCKIYSKYSQTSISGYGYDGLLHTSNYTCGIIKSYKHFKYGYYESRYRETGNDAVSSFWLAGGAACDQCNGYNEIDIQEAQSNATTNILWHTAVYLALPGEHGYNHQISSPDIDTKINLSADFHIFGLDWQPDYIDFYLDGIRYKHITNLPNYFDNTSSIPVNNVNIPMDLMFWVKGGDIVNDHKAFEIDYFHYYKIKPYLSKVVYNSSSNTINFTANSNNVDDSYNWTCTGNVSILSKNQKTATFTLPQSFSNATIKISTTDINPGVTSNCIYTFQQCSGNICNIPSVNSIFASRDIIVPQTGCMSVSVSSNSYVCLVAENTVTLNPGFEVQLGGVLDVFTGK